MKSIRISISLLLICIFSIPVHAKDLVNIGNFPSWFQEAMAREKKLKKKSTLKIKQFDIKKKVLGKAKLVDESDGTWYYNFDIGTETPIECYVFTSYDGPANSLHGIVEMSLQGVEKLNKKTLTGKFNFAVDSGVIGSVPYLLFDTLYTLGEGNGKVSGTLKAMSAKTDTSLQVCLHNEVGYRQTFFKVFTSFVEAFEEKNAKSAFLKSVVQMTLNGVPVGYAQEQYSKDKDGDVEINTESAMIIPVDASSLARSDSVLQSWSMPDGSLINTSEYSIDNAALSSKFNIRKRDEKWHVEGELQGKAFNTVLAHSGPLLSEFGSYLKIQDLSSSDKKATEFFMWASDADPSAALKVKISKISDNPNANFEMDMGPFVMKLLAEKNGIFRQGTLEQSGIKFDMKNIYVKGEPKLP